jgi:Mg/Co/Ni transporter MgtE
VTPVVDDTGRYLGVVDLAATRPLTNDAALCATMLVGDVIDLTVPPVSIDADVREVAQLFSKIDQTALAVVTADGQLVGMIGKAGLFELYRRELIVQET